MQSLWLPNQEWLARLWLAKYIGPVGRGGMYQHSLPTSSHALRHRTLGLRYIANHPFITFLKNKSIQSHKSIFFLMPQNHFLCAMLKGLGLAMFKFAILSFYDVNKTFYDSFACSFLCPRSMLTYHMFVANFALLLLKLIGQLNGHTVSMKLAPMG